MKKVISLILAAALMLGLSAPAFAATPKAGDLLSGNDKVAYDYLVERIDELIQGKTSSTSYRIPLSTFGITNFSFSANDLNLSAVSSGAITDAEKSAVNRLITPDVNWAKVLVSLHADYPEKIYWSGMKGSRCSIPYKYQKTPNANNSGCSIELSPPDGCNDIELILNLYVSRDYSSNANSHETTEVSMDKLTSKTVKDAMKRAEDVVLNERGKSTYEKVLAFGDYICKNVTYDTPYAKSLSSATYGNPSQIINVFDGNTQTNVVCEGYAKAFKYLCELAEIPCYYIEGTSDGTGHAWLLVEMDDGKKYHVDITNCDLDAHDTWNQRLFLKGANVSNNQYTVSYSDFYVGSVHYQSDSIKYVYGAANSPRLWGDQLPTLSTTDYVPAKITFLTEHGDTPDPVIVNYNTEAGELLPVLTANGFNFLGWFNGDTQYTAETVITGPVTLTAKWQIDPTAPTYAVTIDSNMVNGTVTADKPKTVAGDTVTLTVTPNTGYQLKSLSADPSTVEISDGKFTMPAGNVTVSAEFELINYNITYNLDGGTNAAANPASYTVESEDITLAAPTRQGFTFLGWSGDIGLSAEGETPVDPDTGEGTSTATVSMATNVVIPKGSTGDKTFTANWEQLPPNTYAVTFETARGTAPAAQSVPSGKTATEPAAPSAEGYTFDGWLKGDAPFDFRSPITENTVLTAKWTPVTYTIGYELDGGTNAVENPNAYTIESPDFTLAAPTKQGYEFLGWKDIGLSADGETAVDPVTGVGTSTVTAEWNLQTVIKKGSTGNRKFQAGWKQKTSGTPETKPSAEQPAQTPSLTLDRSRMDLYTGDSGQLSAAVTPSATVLWSSSNTRVISVDSTGAWYARSPGSAIITAAANGKSAACYVAVSDYVNTGGYVPPAQTTNRNQSADTSSRTQVTDNADGTRSTITNAPNGTTSIVKTNRSGQVVSQSLICNAARALTSNVLTLPAEVAPAVSAESAAEIQIILPQAAQTSVRVPLTFVTPGTVAVIEGAPGPNEIVRDSHIEGDCLVFTLRDSAVVRVMENTRYFSDVSPSNWFADAVNWASSHGVMSGVSEKRFDPRGTMNRAMMTQILYNYAGATSKRVGTAFSDVNASNWYAGSVTWAVDNGIAHLPYANRFGAMDQLTREDMATMLYNFAKMMGYNTYASGNLAAFADGADVSGWARDAMSWAVGTGLLNGTQNGSRAVLLDPQGTATRAQLASLMQRFCIMFGN